MEGGWLVGWAVTADKTTTRAGSQKAISRLTGRGRRSVGKLGSGARRYLRCFHHRLAKNPRRIANSQSSRRQGPSSRRSSPPLHSPPTRCGAPHIDAVRSGWGRRRATSPQSLVGLSLPSVNIRKRQSHDGEEAHAAATLSSPRRFALSVGLGSRRNIGAPRAGDESGSEGLGLFGPRRAS